MARIGIRRHKLKKSQLIVFLLIVISGPVLGNELTLEKLYPETPLIGVPPRDVLWSPDESRCVFLWNEHSDRIRNLYLFEPDSGSKPQRLTSFDNQGISGYCWGRSSSEIFYLKGSSVFAFNIEDLSEVEIHTNKRRMRSLALSPDGSFLCYLQDGNIWMYEFETGIDTQLTQFDAGKEGISRLSLAPDSRRIAFYFQESTGIRQVDIPRFEREQVSLQKVSRPFPGDPNNLRKIGVLDIKQKKVGWIPLELDTVLSFSWSPTGKKILVEESADYAGKRSIYVCLAEDLNTELVFREENPRFTFSWIWSSQWTNDNSMALTSDRSGFCHLYSLNLINKELKQLTSGEWEVLQTFPITGEDLNFISNAVRPEDRDLFKVHLGSGDVRRISGRDGVYRPYFSKTGKNICVLFSDDKTPFDLYFIVDEKLNRITESQAPEFEQYQWVETSYLDIPGEDGLKIRARMMVPPDFDPDKKYPAIIGSVYSNSVLNQWGGRDAHPTWGLDQYLVQEEKYVLLNLDMRGSLGYGRKFREDMFQGYGVIDIKDIAAAANYLKSFPYIKADKIGIWGSSYGGLMTLMSLFKNPGVFACGVAGAPATNVFHAFPGQMEVLKSAEDKKAYEKSSAYFWSQGLEVPAMIIHGIRDTTVLFMDSVSLAEKMIQEGKDFEFVILPGASHAWDMGPSHQTLFAFRKMIDFFGRHLKN
jgi:dipeptidyl-peptidase-4